MTAIFTVPGFYVAPLLSAVASLSPMIITVRMLIPFTAYFAISSTVLVRRRLTSFGELLWLAM